MLTAIIDWSLRNRFIVIVAALGFVVLGCASWWQLNIDAFPDTTPVQVQINAVAPGLGPLEVESQITFPVEQAIGGLPGLQQGAISLEVWLVPGGRHVRGWQAAPPCSAAA